MILVQRRFKWANRIEEDPLEVVNRFGSRLNGIEGWFGGGTGIPGEPQHIRCVIGLLCYASPFELWKGGRLQVVRKYVRIYSGRRSGHHIDSSCITTPVMD